MSISPFKETQTSSTRLLECCERCGKPNERGFGATITRWVFRSITCECAANQQIESSALTTVASRQLHPGQTDDSGLGDEDQTKYIDLGEGGRHEILEMLGQGGMGTVYRLKDRVLDKEFAVKVLHDNLAAEPSAVKRFEQEADAASQLTHANILATYGRGVTVSGACYILMDLIEGENLSQLLKRETRLDAQRVIHISTQICDALAHAHMKGLIHRDLKPSNIMLTNCDEVTAAVKVVDFGIAKLKATSNRETQNLTETGELFGSPSYMSPEQCLGCAVDSRSDIYSLGCMMYEMLSGQPPFAGKTPILTVVQHLNEPPAPLKVLPGDRTTMRLQAVIMRCLEKDAAQRYQSMDELKIDLLLVAEGRQPKQAKKYKLKEITLTQALVPTSILVADISVSQILDSRVFSYPYEWQAFLQMAVFPLGLICAVLWISLFGQASWKKVHQVTTSQTEWHEKWMAATLVLLTVSVFCIVVRFFAINTGAIVEFLKPLGVKDSPGYYTELGYVNENPGIQSAMHAFAPFLAILCQVSLFLLMVTALGWLLQRTAYILKLSSRTQRSVAFVSLGCFALVGILCFVVVCEHPPNFSVPTSSPLIQPHN